MTAGASVTGGLISRPPWLFAMHVTGLLWELRTGIYDQNEQGEVGRAHPFQITRSAACSWSFSTVSWKLKVALSV